MSKDETRVEEALEIPELESSRSRTLIIIAVLAAAAIGAGAYLMTRGPEASPYRGANVVRASIVKEVRVTGNLELTDQVEVPAPIEGQLVDVLVEPGDAVERGQLLAHLDRVSARVDRWLRTGTPAREVTA